MAWRQKAHSVEAQETFRAQGMDGTRYKLPQRSNRCASLDMSLRAGRVLHMSHIIDGDVDGVELQS